MQTPIPILSSQDLEWRRLVDAEVEIDEYTTDDRLPCGFWSIPGEIVQLSTGRVIADAVLHGMVGWLTEADPERLVGGLRDVAVAELAVEVGTHVDVGLAHVALREGVELVDEDGDPVDLDDLAAELIDGGIAGLDDDDEVREAFVVACLPTAPGPAWRIYVAPETARPYGRRPDRLIVYADDVGEPGFEWLVEDDFAASRVLGYWAREVAENGDTLDAWASWAADQAEELADDVRADLALLMTGGLTSDLGDLDDLAEVAVDVDIDGIAIDVDVSLAGLALAELAAVEEAARGAGHPDLPTWEERAIEVRSSAAAKAIRDALQADLDAWVRPRVGTLGDRAPAHELIEVVHVDCLHTGTDIDIDVGPIAQTVPWPTVVADADLVLGRLAARARRDGEPWADLVKSCAVAISATEVAPSAAPRRRPCGPLGGAQ